MTAHAQPRGLLVALAFFLGAITAATHVTADSAARVPPQSKRTFVVAALGDSLSDPKSEGAKYLQPLRAACPESRFDAYGVGGNMTNMMRKRLARDVLGEGGDGTKPAYTHLIVLGGIGDILSNETAKRTEAPPIRWTVSLFYAAILSHFWFMNFNSN